MMLLIPAWRQRRPSESKVARGLSRFLINLAGSKGLPNAHAVRLREMAMRATPVRRVYSVSRSWAIAVDASCASTLRLRGEGGARGRLPLVRVSRSMACVAKSLYTLNQASCSKMELPGESGTALEERSVGSRYRKARIRWASLRYRAFGPSESTGFGLKVRFSSEDMRRSTNEKMEEANGHIAMWIREWRQRLQRGQWRPRCEAV